MLIQRPLGQNSSKPATWVVNEMMRQIHGIRETAAMQREGSPEYLECRIQLLNNLERGRK